MTCGATCTDCCTLDVSACSCHCRNDSHSSHSTCTPLDMTLSICALVLDSALANRSGFCCNYFKALNVLRAGQGTVKVAPGTTQGSALSVLQGNTTFCMLISLNSLGKRSTNNFAWATCKPVSR